MTQVRQHDATIDVTVGDITTSACVSMAVGLPDGPIRRRKRGYILTMDQSNAGSAGIFSQWTNQSSLGAELARAGRTRNRGRATVAISVGESPIPSLIFRTQCTPPYAGD
eukprot:1082359-Prorocentrum_minimum.AAC.2